MYLLGLDIGTTHCKAGLFRQDGTLKKLAILPTNSKRNAEGFFYYSPEGMWQTILTVLKEATEGVSPKFIYSLGITSMSESGILLDRRLGTPKSEVIPWFDTRAMNEYKKIFNEENHLERFKRTGLHASFKYGLAKILWLKNQNPDILDGGIWLSVADYIAFRLTGSFYTDYSLAARTYAYRIDKKEWDEDWLLRFGISKDLFPDVYPSGTPVGKVSSESFLNIGLRKGLPVAVSGHDHLCCSVAAGAIYKGVTFDSMGTAETLLGPLDERPLGLTEFESGLSYGIHVIRDSYFWMGGIPSSGGSVEWLRSNLGDPPLSYSKIESLLNAIENKPTNIIFMPYLSGSGAPAPDPSVMGAFIGLKKTHNRSYLLRAVLEGTAYELESIRRTAERIADYDIYKIFCLGGGTNNASWMQIKADVSKCEFRTPQLQGDGALGAALIAAVETGYYKNIAEACQPFSNRDEHVFLPNGENHQQYKEIFEKQYLWLQKPLREFYNRQN